MGVTLSSKNRAMDMSYFGLKRLRSDVAKLISIDFYNHYESLFEFFSWTY